MDSSSGPMLENRMSTVVCRATAANGVARVNRVRSCVTVQVPNAPAPSANSARGWTGSRLNR